MLTQIYGVIGVIRPQWVKANSNVIWGFQKKNQPVKVDDVYILFLYCTGRHCLMEAWVRGTVRTLLTPGDTTHLTLTIRRTCHLERYEHNNSPFCQVRINSLAPGRFQYNRRKIIFKLILVTDGSDISSEIVRRLTSRDLSDDKSTLVQVMGWCLQATSHCMNQCWPRSLPPYGVTRPQWVNDRIWFPMWEMEYAEASPVYQGAWYWPLTKTFLLKLIVTSIWTMLAALINGLRLENF